MRAEMNLYDYIQVFRKRRLIISIVFIGIFSVNLFYLRTQPKVYIAEARVKVLERKTLGGLLAEWFTYTPGDPMESQASVARSYPVVERAIIALGLAGEKPDQAALQELSRSIQAGVNTKVEKNTNIITISYTDNDARRATRIVNAIAESFIEQNLLEKNKEARRVREFIQGQIKELKEKLESSEQALKSFKESGEATGIAVALQNKIAELETEKTKLLRIYTERHPNVISLKEEEGLVREQLKTIPEKELQYAQLIRELEINEKIYRTLQEKFEEARIAEIEKTSDITLVDPAFIPESPITRSNVGFILGVFAALVIAFSTGFVAEQLDTSIGTIEEVEGFLKLPVIGIIPYLGVKTDSSKTKKRGWSAAFSGRDKKRGKAYYLPFQLLFNYSSSSTILESYKILRTNIQMDIFKGAMQNKAVLVSSAGPEEGKSITSVNLALTLAQGGNRVLLIDADLRRASLYKIFGFTKKDIGLSDVLRKATPIEGAIKTFSDLLICNPDAENILNFPGMDNLNIMLAGSSLHLPSELLSTKEISTLIATFKNKFDVVVLDTPPVLAVADTALIAPYADAVILVYKVGRTAKNAIMRAKAQLDAVNAPCRGIVLNNISRAVEIRSEYYYHYKRYGY